MRKLRVLILAAAPFLAWPLPAQTPATGASTTQPAAAGMKEAKDGTVLFYSRNGSGTGFFISDSGLFITCGRTLHRTSYGGLNLILHPSMVNEKKYTGAGALQEFPGYDLAVLRVKMDEKASPLKLGDDSKLVETQVVHVLGYPPLTDLSDNAKSFPPIETTTSRITSIQRKDGVLESIQLDTPLNAESTGLPVLDEKGEVVGIASSGTGNSGATVIPVSVLKKVLSVPRIQLGQPALPFLNRFEPADFVIVVDWWLPPPAAEPVVTLEITNTGQTRRVTAVKNSDGRYHVSVPPVPTPPSGTDGPPQNPGPITYKAIVATADGKTVFATDQGGISLRPPPPGLALLPAATPPPPPDPWNGQTIELPGAVDNVVAAKGDASSSFTSRV